MGKLKSKSNTLAASNKTSITEMYPPKKLAVATQPLTSGECIIHIPELKAFPFNDTVYGQTFFYTPVKVTPPKPVGVKIASWKPTKEAKSLIRTPTKKTILRALGLKKGLKIEKSAIVGSGEQLDWANDKVVGLHPLKVFEVKTSSTEDYLYNNLNVGEMCRKNKFAKKVKKVK